METFTKIETLSWLAADGSRLPMEAPRVTGHYFRYNAPPEAPKAPAGDALTAEALALLQRPPANAEAPSAGPSGGAKVPVSPSPPRTPNPGGAAALISRGTMAGRQPARRG